MILQHLALSNLSYVNSWRWSTRSMRRSLSCFSASLGVHPDGLFLSLQPTLNWWAFSTLLRSINILYSNGWILSRFLGASIIHFSYFFVAFYYDKGEGVVAFWPLKNERNLSGRHASRKRSFKRAYIYHSHYLGRIILTFTAFFQTIQRSLAGCQ